MKDDIYEKDAVLGQILTDLGRVMVAFSGGVDSSLVLKRAQMELGKNVTAVVVASEMYRQEEFDQAVELAEELGVEVITTEIKELDCPEIVANGPDTWYYSKKLLYEEMNRLAAVYDFPYVVDGMIKDDESDFRPGLKARTEAGVRSVLQEADLYKEEVRDLAQHIDLPVWDKPASCSLASRIPYGEPITIEKIKQVEEAEQFIKTLGFSQVRVRYHGTVARIEVPIDKMLDLLDHRELIQHKLTSLGFTFVSLDIGGFQSGNMNKSLSDDASETV